MRKDNTYDGIFYLAVRTTGIFCRPSCTARKPLPKNVEFFSTTREAVFAGYRPCKVCKPMEAAGAPPEWAGALLSMIEQDPAKRYSDSFLRSKGIEPSRARRFFLKNYGMTFQAYCRGRRLGTSFEQIRNGVDLDDVALGYGYNSHSGFRDAFKKTFGAAPGQARNGESILTAWIESPFGPMIAAATSKGICLLEFTDRRMLDNQFKRLRRYYHCAIVPGENSHLAQLKKELKEYFAGERKTFTVSLVIQGSPFEEKVWKALLAIPSGKTATYEEIARLIGQPKSSRAVGRANGMNRIAIVVPCHRVINKNGELGGYGGGVWRKKILLDLERQQ